MSLSLLYSIRSAALSCFLRREQAPVTPKFCILAQYKAVLMTVVDTELTVMVDRKETLIENLLM